MKVTRRTTLSLLSLSVIATICQSCKDCTTPTHTQDFNLQKLQLELSKFLTKLGLESRPEVKIKLDDVPSVLVKRNAQKDTEEKTEDTGDLDENTNPGEFFVIGKKPNPGLTINHKCMTNDGKLAACFQFDMLEKSTLFTKPIESAGLMIYLEPSPKFQTSATHTLVVSEIVKLPGRLQTSVQVISTDQIVFTNKWTEVNITSSAIHWQQMQDQSTHVLQVSCPTCPNDAKVPFGVSGRSIPSVHIALEPQIGRKRRSDLCMAGDGQSCCLEKFTVNFTEIGWSDWILQPRTYEANYCSGTCRSWATRHHSRLVLEKVLREGLQESQTEGWNKMIPCCAPTRMGSLDVIYALTEGEIRKRTIPDMIVHSCGC